VHRAADCVREGIYCDLLGCLRPVAGNDALQFAPDEA